MITIYRVPEQQDELDEFIAGKIPEVDYHAWHDVPEFRWVIYTGEDMPPIVHGEEV